MIPRRSIALLGLAAVIGLSLSAAPVLAARPTARFEVAGHLRHDPGTLSVRFAPGVDTQEGDTIAAAAGLAPVGRLVGLGITQYRPTDGGPPGRALASLRRNARVGFAELPVPMRALAEPDDTFRSAQWGLDAINAPAGWELTTGSFGAVIAVVDTGVDFSHPDLRAKLLPGYDFFAGDGNPQDVNGHGTLVAGVAAAVSDNERGISGTSWASEILPVRALGPQGEGSDQTVASAIKYAADRGARVINLSLGGPGSSSTLDAAIDYALARKVVLVAAAGNEGPPLVSSFSSVNYPAASEPVVAVGSVSETSAGLTVSSFSSRGDELDVVAPGDDIWTTDCARCSGRPALAAGTYDSVRGTSFAAPFVSGLAALMLSRNPDLSSAQVQSRIRSTARDLGPSGDDRDTGRGLVDVRRALATTTAPYASDGQAPSLRPLDMLPGTMVRGTVTVTARAWDASGVAQADLDYGNGIRRFAHPLRRGQALEVSTAWTSTANVDGLRVWTARAVDAAGNARSLRMPVLVANDHLVTRRVVHDTTGSAGAELSYNLLPRMTTPFVARVSGNTGTRLTLRLVRASNGAIVATGSGGGAAHLAVPSLTAGTYRLRVSSASAGTEVVLTAAWFRPD
ncbi:MAG: S8 family serine peptidase [Chloroflexi bacterium]|nr:S8 family serine peptidase [Chloroflexota bacterium]